MGILQNITIKFAQVTQGIDGIYVAGEDLEHEINQLSIRTVTISAIALAVLILIAALLKDHAPKLKLPLFLMIAFVMAGSFLTMAGATIYLNTKADSGGPVHWHADIEYWVCDNQVELRDPTGRLSNKIGSPVLHEHNDQRIHLEGVVVDGVKDASLGKFMHVTGGAITDNALVLPVNSAGEGSLIEDEVDGDGENGPSTEQLEALLVSEGTERFVRAIDGQQCGDATGDVQVFVYQYNGDDKTYTQKKLTKPQEYIIYEDANVPPGDCIIVEFSESKPFTDKLCEQYGVRDIEKCESFGVEPSKRKICENTDATDYEGLQAEFDGSSIPTSSQTDDNLDLPINTDNSDPQTQLSLCDPFFDENGDPTGVEIAVLKDDGSLLDPVADCADFQNGLKAQAEAPPADESDEIEPVIEEEN